MTNNNTPLLAAFGISLELSSEDMRDITIDIQSAISDDEPAHPLDAVTDVTKDTDAKTLWRGAALYGFILDSYADIDVTAALNDGNRKT